MIIYQRHICPPKPHPDPYPYLYLTPMVTVIGTIQASTGIPTRLFLLNVHNVELMY